MAVIQQADLVDIVVDAGESAKNLQRPGIARVLALVNAGGEHRHCCQAGPPDPEHPGPR